MRGGYLPSRLAHKEGIQPSGYLGKNSLHSNSCNLLKHSDWEEGDNTSRTGNHGKVGGEISSRGELKKDRTQGPISGNKRMQKHLPLDALVTERSKGKLRGNLKKKEFGVRRGRKTSPLQGLIRLSGLLLSLRNSEGEESVSQKGGKVAVVKTQRPS